MPGHVSRSDTSSPSPKARQRCGRTKPSICARALLDCAAQMSSPSRSELRRRPRRRRHLTPSDWEDLREKVVEYDLLAITVWARQTGRTPVTIESDGSIRVTRDRLTVCPAVVMDPSQLGTCSGRWNLDHVKYWDDVSPQEKRPAGKAPDDEGHLVDLCATHDERGAKAGAVWNTAHREDERAYIRWRQGLRSPDVRS